MNEINKKKKKEIDFSNKRTFAFKFMYIGQNYDGLVIQPSTQNTIEEHLFNAFKKCSLLENKKNEELLEISNYSRCGRTDKGVNSSGNVFSVNLRYDEKFDYVRTLNNILPNDIYILSYKEVDDSFDARFSCLYREYKYYFLKKNMNIEKMQKASKLLTGVHNFKNFCKIDKSDPNWQTKNFERRIYDIKIIPLNNSFIYPFNISDNLINNDYYKPYLCIIKGSAFLWHQVRCIMKILFLIGEELEDITLINEMLNIKNNYEFNYGLADDCNLVLSDCVFEFINFFNDRNIVGNDLYFKLEKIYQNNIFQCIINTHFFNVIFNKNFNLNIDFLNENNKKDDNIKLEDTFNEINKSRKHNKYTKLLNIKTNREKNKKSKK